jgi:hypothetical protein
MATPTNLPATAVSGQILTAAYVNDLRGAFRVLQVVYGSTTTNVTESAGAFVDTGLTATITPQSTSNKILVIVNQNGCLKAVGNANNALNLKLLRGSTNIANFLTSGGYTATSSDNIFGSSAVTVLDSPATTSAVTYKTQMQNQQAAANVQTQFNSALSTIVLLEISA